MTEKNKILMVYGLFLLAIFVHLYPVGIMGLIAVIIATIVLIFAYNYKKKSKKNSLTNNHMIYLIRTIWIGSAYLLICIFVSGIYMAPRIDLTILNMIQSGQFIPGSYEEIKALEKRFFADNQPLIFYGLVIAFAPAVMFFFYRIIKGASRVSKNKKIAKPLSWL